MDITGFDEQIGFLPKINLPKINFKNPIPKNLPGTSFLKNKIQAMKPAVKPNVSLTNLANRAKAMQVKPTASAAPKGGLLAQLNKAKAMQVKPTASAAPKGGLLAQFNKAKVQQAIQKAKQTGKSLIVKTPLGVKKLTPKTPFNLVPTATASKAPFSFFKPALAPIKKDEVKKFENRLQAMPATQQAKAIFNLPPTPVVVRNLNPTQRSFLKTDLPYQVISRNNFGQPTTQIIKNTPFKFNISVDQIQPPVDGGISNYYGK
jgi:hypothetical protein